MKKVNGNNVEYIVLFGTDRYSPQDHVTACRKRFPKIKEAREYAKHFSNAGIFKLQWRVDSDLPDITNID